MNSAAPVGVLLSEWRASLHPTGGRLTDALTPLLGKPLLQRAMEGLVRLGCRQVHVFLGDTPAPVKALLDNGDRWGVQITYHYDQDDLPLAANLKRLDLSPDQTVALTCDDTLPLDWPSEASTPTAPFWQQPDPPQWAGAALLPFAWLQGCQAVLTRQDLENRLLADPDIQHPSVPQPLCCSSDAVFLRSAQQLLAQAATWPPGRGAIVHPSAQLVQPVYLGHQVRIGPHARIGPNAVLEDRCVVDDGAEVRDSVVLADTYVGHDLNLTQCVVKAGSLANVAQGVLLPVMDPILLAPVRTEALLAPPNWRQRLGLQALRWVLRPWAKVALNRLGQRAMGMPRRMLLPLPGGNASQTQRLALSPTVAGLHAPRDRWALLAHFALTFYPGLADAQQGRLALWGPDLREAGEVAQLPAHWRALYQSHRAGLLSPGVMMAVQGTHHTGTDRYLNDVTAATETPATWPLLWSYLAAVARVLKKP